MVQKQYYLEIEQKSLRRDPPRKVSGPHSLARAFTWLQGYAAAVEAYKGRVLSWNGSYGRIVFSHYAIDRRGAEHTTDTEIEIYDAAKKAEIDGYLAEIAADRK
jgi:hypothetical protein